ncbi:hypothetical protein HX13_03535 [Chryseobacterium sp. P1-3]|uniref:hypothetical protein n=1 Tax=Chryseobacterium sp. (strain P1-3) TaxID=1517683 RepID=UPI0004E72291|nr:hypothetical protein [Chryseobacterium sp. P1-3]KFF75311.1 hypothetical protein HX13_03535 [Chryseobacterium sp. P1-3]
MAKTEIPKQINEELLEDPMNMELSEQTMIRPHPESVENTVFPHQTTTNNHGDTAWWQCNEAGKEQVQIRLRDKKILTWKPPVSTLEQPTFRGCLLYFYENYLIIKYKDKHYQRLFIFNIHTLRNEEILIDALTIRVKIIGNELFLAGFYSDEELIKITMHPDHIERENIDETYLQQRNITFD